MAISKDFVVKNGLQVGSSLQVNSTATFSNDVTISGNLTVSGTTTYVNTATLNIADNIVTLNADVSGATSPTENAGLEVNRGSSANVQLRWNETTDSWEQSNAGLSVYYKLLANNDILDSLVSTSITVAASANSVKAAYDTAISQGSTAYSNATTYASNATNISSGTLNTARLPAQVNVSANLNIGAFGTTNGVNIQNTAIIVGNSTANATVAYNLLQASNATSTANLSPVDLKIGSAIVNSTVLTITTVNATTVNANTSGIHTGNVSATVVNASANVNAPLVFANVTGTYANITGQVNTATFYAATSANVGGNVQITVSQYGITGNVTTAPTMSLTGSALTIGNSSITGAPSINLANSTGNTTVNVTSIGSSWGLISNASGVYHSGLVNAASLTVGSSFIANLTAIVGTGYANVTGAVNASSHTVGTTFTANATLVNAAAINIVNQTNTATLFVTTSANVGGNVQITVSQYGITGNATTVPTMSLTASSLTIGNSTVTGAPTINLANSTGNTTVNVTSIGTSWGLISNASGVYHSGVVNAASHTTTTTVSNTTGFFPTTNAIALGNSIGLWVISANSLGANSITVTGGNLNAATVYATGLVNAANFTTTGTVNTATVFATGQINAASHTTTNSVSNTSGFFPISNAAVGALGNSTGLWVVLANSVTTNTLTVSGGTITSGNVNITGYVNASANLVAPLVFANVSAGYANVTGQVNTVTFFATTSANVGGNVQITVSQYGITGNATTVPTMSLTASALTIGNSTVTGAPSINLANSTGNTTVNVTSIGSSWGLISNASGVYHSGATAVINAFSHTSGSGFIANSTAIVGTGFANVTTSVNSALLTVGTSFIANTTGAYHTGTVNAASHTVGTTFTANATLVNAAAINVTGQINTATLYAITSTPGFYAVYGYSNSSVGVYAISNTGYGVSGTSNSGVGVYAQSNFNNPLVAGNNTTTFITINSSGNMVAAYNVNAANFVTTGTVNTATVYATGTVNAASYTVGTSFIANSTAIVGTGYANVTTSVNSALLTVGTAFTANATALVHTGFANVTTSVNSALLTVGTAFTANATLVNAAALNVVNQVNTATLYATTSANVGANVQLTTSQLFIGNSTVNNTTNTSYAFIGNSTVYATTDLTAPTGTVVAERYNTGFDSSTFGKSVVTTYSNTTVTAARSNYGQQLVYNNLGLHANSLGVATGAQLSDIYGFASFVYSGNSASGGNARIDSIFGIQADVRNYANGTTANTINSATALNSVVRQYGSGTITAATGIIGTVTAANSSVTGAITTAYGVKSSVSSNTAMTIGTAYLFYGQSLGASPSTNTTSYGVYCTGESNNYFSGNMRVSGALGITGALTKGSGTFLIDHPLDPTNKDLYHGFVEAPRYDLIYRGEVTLEHGSAEVDIDIASNMTPGTFDALTQNQKVTSLQNQTGFDRVKPLTIANGKFTIISESNTSNDTIVWVVMGERKDVFIKTVNNTDSEGRLIPEWDKEE